MASSSPANDSDNNHHESFLQHLLRATKNCFTRCSGKVQSTDERAKIKVKEMKIANRKKQFGVDYMTRVLEHDATDSELQAIVEQCKSELLQEQREIDELQEEIERIHRETERKIQVKPTTQGTTGNTGTTNTNPADTAAGTAGVAAMSTSAAAAMPLATVPDPVFANAPAPAPTAPVTPMSTMTEPTSNVSDQATNTNTDVVV
ncbi:hypothetical protein MPSEU_000326100 [Mayamaea pseudoterrestris]|nr:hypothetical protein MPSEU_000326100 [Mayamaea pseudoterrestris]